jgi:quinol monooxygenase YgiN
MLEQVVRLTVNMTVKDGKLDEFKSVAQSLTEGSQSEPGTIGYEWFASKDGKSFRLVETYVDAAAVEAHFTGSVVQKGVPKLVALCKVDAFEIYGDPGPKVTAIATGLGAKIFPYWLGLNR